MARVSNSKDRLQLMSGTPRSLRVKALLRMAAVLSVLFCASSAGAALPSIDTSAKQAIMVDAGTGAVLFAKAADERMAPSSMSKMMTLYVLFERLKEGRIKLDDTLAVSEKAWRTGGSKMFVQIGSRVRVDDLIQGIAVQSGNDACVVVAEGLSGSEQAFAEEMNKKAKELGLSASHFVDASGLPDPQQYMTARDLVTLARRLIVDFPQYYHYFNEIEFTFNGIKQGNRNPLLYKTLNVDGLKTGHTEAGGYGLTASAVRDGRRIILVLNGMSSVNERSRESEKLLDWGYREWGDYTLFKAGEKVSDADVWLGTQSTVPLISSRDFVVTLPHLSRDKMKVTVSYDGPLPAPIAKGAAVAKLSVEAPDVPTVEVGLDAAEPVERLGALGRIGAALHYLVWGPPK
ncbi:MAG TPA: D-alanyl-D-alanine carboxypeptidase family protein [Alphaproteobacteria bacterium]|nr:D-alanyl-D-alanine carboxypeptidase family protein [Alphaproteobacteria bacterium]